MLTDSLFIYFYIVEMKWRGDTLPIWPSSNSTVAR